MTQGTLARTALACIAFAASCAASAPAQAQSWDRIAEQIAIVSKPGDPAGMYRISAAWSVEAANASLLPLGTSVAISRNGTVIYSALVDIQASAGALGSCDNCPSPNTCVCAVPDGPCSCNALWLTTDIPNAIPLAVGDVLKMALFNAGGVAETNTANDTLTRIFNGKPMFWNRRVGSASLAPSACPETPDAYDLTFTHAVDFAQMSGEIDFEGVVQVLLNGAVAAEFDYCNDSPWITTGASCIAAGSCGLVSCGTGSCAGASVDLDCQMVEIQGGAAETCVCSSGDLQYVLHGIVLRGLTQDSSVKVVVKSNIGTSLPELSLLESDNSVEVSLGEIFSPCIADVNKDGVVNGGDLAIVLGAWGPCSE